MACSVKKPKTRASSKTRTLDSFVKHKANLSKKTEEDLNKNFRLWKRAKVYDRRAKKYKYLEDTKEAITKKGTSSKKVAGPSLSKSTEDRLKASYTKRKTARRSAAPKRFVAGGIYNLEYGGSVEVVSRTPKTLVIHFRDISKKDRRCNIQISKLGNVEMIYPYGSGYANNVILYASELARKAPRSSEPSKKSEGNTVVARLPKTRSKFLDDHIIIARPKK